MFAVVWLSENVFFEYDIWNTNYKVLLVVEQQHKSEIMFLVYFPLSPVRSYFFIFSFANKFI